MSENTASGDAQIIDAKIVRPRRRWPWAVLLAALVFAGAAGGLYWQTKRLIESQAASGADALASVRADMDALGKRLDALAVDRESITGMRDEVHQQIQVLQEKQTAFQRQISTSISNLASAPGRADEGWMLKEAQYLLTVAEQRLRLERDVDTAMAAAESVDKRLAESSNPAFIPIREQLIADISALRAVPDVDLAGVTLTLANFIERVDALPLKGGDIKTTSLAEDATPSPEAGATAGPAGWRGLLGRMWKDLISLVDVKSVDVPDDVIFDPGKRFFLQQNLRLELAAARLEALRRDNGNFRASLQRIETTLDRYYDTTSAEVATIRDAFQPMKDLDLAPTLPSFEKSLQLLRAQVDAASAPPPPALPSPEATPTPAP